MFSEFVTGKAIEVVLDLAKQRVQKAVTGASVATDAAQVEQAISSHLDYVRRWSSEVSFADLLRPKETSRIFVPLDAYVVPRRLQLDSETPRQAVPLFEAMADCDRHMILLGVPGAGKTTTSKYLAHRLITDEGFLPSLSFPLVVRLEELNSHPSPEDDLPGYLLLTHLSQLLGLSVALPAWLMEQKDSETRRQRLLFDLLATSLNGLRPLVLLDGFDEVEPGIRRKDVIQALSFLATKLESSTVLMTSRTGEFAYSVDHCHQFEIAPLNEQQIARFAASWLGDSEEAVTFVKKVHASPFGDGAIRPLTLAHLCAIYERTSSIPAKPRTVYRKIVNLLLEEWDQQRGVKRTSGYADFEPDRKAEFLAELAYTLSIRYRRGRFSRLELAATYRHTCRRFGLEPQDAMRVVAEIEGHSGLLVQTGYEEFSFAHKSIQEFLAAEHLVRLPSLPSPSDLKLIPNEVAIAVAISSNAGEYLRAVFRERAMWQFRRSGWVGSFAARLLLEAPELVGNKQVGETLVFLFTAYVEDWLDRGSENFDSTCLELMRLLERLVKIEALQFVASGYSSDGVSRDDIARFVRRSESSLLTQDDGGEAIFASKLPPVLYLPRSLAQLIW